MYGIYIEWNLCDAVNQVVETMHLPFPDPHSFVSTISFSHSFFPFQARRRARRRSSAKSMELRLRAAAKYECRTRGGRRAGCAAVGCGKNGRGTGPPERASTAERCQGSLSPKNGCALYNSAQRSIRTA